MPDPITMRPDCVIAWISAECVWYIESEMDACISVHNSQGSLSKQVYVVFFHKRNNGHMVGLTD